MLASPCLAAQREARNRGPSVTERRAVEAAAAEAEQERLEQQRLARRGTASRVVSTALVLSSRNGAGEVPLGTRKLGRGRAAMNTPLQLGGAVKNLEERKASLLAAAEFRPTHRVVAVAPVGTGKLDEAPDRMDFEVATASGAAEFSAAMIAYVDKTFDGAGIEARTADAHEVSAGFFGYWHEMRGHGVCVEWQQLDNGWELRAVRGVTGELTVPTFASVMEFALLVSRVCERVASRVVS